MTGPARLGIRAIVPLLATRVLRLEAFTAAFTFIMVFGSVKAIANLFAGTLCYRFGRKPVLAAGWLIGLPAPLIVIWAPTWAWVVAASLRLGINQGLTWSTTVDHEDRSGWPETTRPRHGAE